MQLSLSGPFKSLAPPLTDPAVELPELVILSGPNGAGKSTLLEAISLGLISINGIYRRSNEDARVRFIQAGALAASDEPAQSASQYSGNWRNLLSQAATWIRNVGQERLALEGPVSAEKALVDHLVLQRLVTADSLSRMKEAAGKPLIEFSEDDYRSYTPLLLHLRDPFAVTMGEVFLTYHSRHQRNRFLRFQESESKVRAGSISDAEFELRHGPPPWDLMTESMASVGLPYRFVPPPLGIEEDLTYEPAVVHDQSGAEISPNSLSSGERTLLAIAMSLYVGTNLKDSVRMPEVLLLDEADATLHPTMIKSLLTVLSEVFVARHGVKVLLTTHSPTTVALAPERSLYLMERSGIPPLRAAGSRDQALKVLTVGIPTLSVKVENRRQVFVESEQDEEFYQDLFTLVRPQLDTELSLQFIASGRGGQGNSAAVKHLVRNLRSAGNESVLGIVDRDKRPDTVEGVMCAEERYTLENFVLDPVPLGILLVREQIVPPEQLGLPAGFRHLEITTEYWQTVIDSVSARVANSESDLAGRSVLYANGTSATMPTYWLEEPGHALEARILESFPALRRFQGKLKRKSIQLAMGDVPGSVPMAQLDLFRRLLAF